MHGVGPPPEIVGRQRQDADRAADPIVGEAMPEERAMAAIVLDHEQADKKARGGNRQQQIKPVSEVEREPHRQPKQNERHGRDQDLDDAAPMMRFAIAGESLGQSAHVDNRGVAVGVRSVVQDFLRG